MTVYLAFLRGINVGGKNSIRMADLKGTFLSLGFRSVETYIQSGNVLFETVDLAVPSPVDIPVPEEAVLRHRIESAVEADFGIRTGVVLRTEEEIDSLVSNCPFSDVEISEAQAANTEGESFYVSLFPIPLDPEQIRRMESFSGEPDVMRIRDRDVYLLFRQSIRHSKLARVTQDIGISSTVRNWKTILKLQALARSRKGNAGQPEEKL